MVEEANDEILKHNKGALMPIIKDFIIDVGQVALAEGHGLDEAGIAAVKEGIKKNVLERVMQTYQEIWDGDIEKISDLPVESFLPLLVLRHLGSFAKSTDMTSKHFQYGFDPEMVYEKYRPKTTKKDALLKPIESYFSTPDEDEDDFLFQFIIDENAINSFILDFVLIDKNFSIRDLLSVDPKSRELVE